MTDAQTGLGLLAHGMPLAPYAGTHSLCMLLCLTSLMQVLDQA